MALSIGMAAGAADKAPASSRTAPTSGSDTSPTPASDGADDSLFSLALGAAEAIAPLGGNASSSHAVGASATDGHAVDAATHDEAFSKHPETPDPLLDGALAPLLAPLLVAAHTPTPGQEKDSDAGDGTTTATTARAAEPVAEPAARDGARGVVAGLTAPSEALSGPTPGAAPPLKTLGAGAEHPSGHALDDSTATQAAAADRHTATALTRKDDAAEARPAGAASDPVAPGPLPSPWLPAPPDNDKPSIPGDGESSVAPVAAMSARGPAQDQGALREAASTGSAGVLPATAGRQAAIASAGAPSRFAPVQSNPSERTLTDPTTPADSVDGRGQTQTDPKDGKDARITPPDGDAAAKTTGRDVVATGNVAGSQQGARDAGNQQPAVRGGTDAVQSMTNSRTEGRGASARDADSPGKESGRGRTIDVDALARAAASPAHAGKGAVTSAPSSNGAVGAPTGHGSSVAPPANDAAVLPPSGAADAHARISQQHGDTQGEAARDAVILAGLQRPQGQQGHADARPTDRATPGHGIPAAAADQRGMIPNGAGRGAAPFTPGGSGAGQGRSSSGRGERDGAGPNSRDERAAPTRGAAVERGHDRTHADSDSPSSAIGTQSAPVADPAAARQGHMQGKDIVRASALLTPIAEGVVVRQAALRAGGGVTSFHVVMQPQALGTVTVHVEKIGHTLQVTIVPQHAEAGALLDRHATELVGLLNSPDFESVNVSVAAPGAHHGSEQSAAHNDAAPAPSGQDSFMGQGFSAGAGFGGGGQGMADSRRHEPQWSPWETIGTGASLPAVPAATAGIRPAGPTRAGSGRPARIDIQV